MTVEKPSMSFSAALKQARSKSTSQLFQPFSSSLSRPVKRTHSLPSEANIQKTAESLQKPYVSLVGWSERQRPVCQVVSGYIPSLWDELALIPGQLVEIIEEYIDEWAYGYIINTGMFGVLPLPCVEMVWMQERMVLREHIASVDEELSIIPGQKLEIMQVFSNGWACGRVKSEKKKPVLWNMKAKETVEPNEGLFPLSRVGIWSLKGLTKT